VMALICAMSSRRYNRRLRSIIPHMTQSCFESTLGLTNRALPAKDRRRVLIVATPSRHAGDQTARNFPNFIATVAADCSFFCLPVCLSLAPPKKKYKCHCVRDRSLAIASSRASVHAPTSYFIPRNKNFLPQSYVCFSRRATRGGALEIARNNIDRRNVRS